MFIIKLIKKENPNFIQSIELNHIIEPKASLVVCIFLILFVVT